MGPSAMCSLRPVVALALAALCVFPGGAAATTYTVGDSAGWDISADLDKWPLNKTFAIGDVLSFQYSSYYSVAEVNMEGFYNCSTANAIQTGNGGSTEITITTTGHKYFICPLPFLCFGGMRLHVQVGADDPPAAAPVPPQDGGNFPEFNVGGSASGAAISRLPAVVALLSGALVVGL